MPEKIKNVPAVKISAFIAEVLKKLRVAPDVAFHVKAALVQTALRGVDSHAIRLFPHYVRALEAGRINPRPKYKFKQTAAATGTLDADHTFGHAAGGYAMERSIKLARKSGVGAVGVYHSSHFGAASYFALLAAHQNMLGLSFTHADSLLLTYGGKRPYFGTNPICMAAPCAGEGPFCLDMATSITNWNRVKQHREKKMRLPAGLTADKNGLETRDAFAACSIFPIGGYKGFGLSMMVEVLCGLMTGMPFGRDITSMFVHPIDKHRHLGQFFMAIDISRFQNVNTFKRRMKTMMNEVRREPRLRKDVPVLAAGDPEKINFKIRSKIGIPVEEKLMKEFEEISLRLNVPRIVTK